MGRRRKDGNPLGLEKRVYPHHGQFWYRHLNGDAEALGKDVDSANARARVYNDPQKRYGTLGYWIDRFIAEARAGRLLRKYAPRTIDDWEHREAPPLKLAFDKKSPEDLVRDPSLVTKYRDNRTAKVRCNRELSLLSSVYAWLIEQNHWPGLTINPVRLIRRNPEKPKERYVEDQELQPVHGIAQRSVCMAMDLVYRSLQRPEDVLKARPQDIRQKSVAGTVTTVLSVRQNKTGRTVDIEVTPELDAALKMLSGGPVARFAAFLVHPPAPTRLSRSKRPTAAALHAHGHRRDAAPLLQESEGEDLRTDGYPGEGRNGHVPPRCAARAHPDPDGPQERDDDRDLHQAPAPDDLDRHAEQRAPAGE